MADNLTEFPILTKKVSELSSATTLDGTETLLGIQSSTSKKATVSDVFTYINNKQKGLAHYYMNSNATATTIGATDTFVKVAGATTQGVAPVNFTLASNKATYSLDEAGTYKVSAVLSMSAGNNEDIRARVGLNGTTQARGEQDIETDGAGDAHTITVQDIVELTASTDYIEVFVANGTSTTDITVSNLHVIIEKIH